MKFAHMICGLAALVLPTIALAKDEPRAAVATNAAVSDTLFSGTLDIPVADGSNVPDNCNFPAALSASAYELACVVAEGEANEELDVEYISWLGQHGWRYGADIIGGFEAVRETSAGCEQSLRVYPHGEDDAFSGIWFALERQPRCAARNSGSQ